MKGNQNRRVKRSSGQGECESIAMEKDDMVGKWTYGSAIKSWRGEIKRWRKNETIREAGRQQVTRSVAKIVTK